MTTANNALYLLFANPNYGSNIAVNSNITFTFSEPVIAGVGYITIKNNLGEIVLNESITGPNVTIVDNVVTLNPSVDFAFMTNYNVSLSSGIVTTKDGVAYQAPYYTISSFTTEYSNVAVNFTGTDQGDMIHGGSKADTLNGGGGSDTIYGYEGDDIIHGDAGSDLLNGGAGDDNLYGDSDNDNLTGGAGNDNLYGGSGDDSLYDIEGNNTLIGGDGDDRLSSGYYNYVQGEFNQLHGGAGNDEINAIGSDNVTGDEGDDVITFLPNTLQTRAAEIDGGIGNDKFMLGTANHNNTINIRLGAGSDTIAFYDSYATLYSNTHYVIQDFSAGTGGDKIDLGSLLKSVSDVNSNPFATDGYMRLIKVGSDTLLQYKSTYSNDSNFLTLLTFNNLSPTDFTSANFIGGINPDGSQSGITIVGTNGNDFLRGNILNDHISGLSGSDTIYGGSGDDTLIGGTEDSFQDNDNLYGEEGNDLLIGGAGDDTLSGGSGDDTLEGGSGNDILVDDRGFNILRGQDGNDEIWISALNADAFKGGIYEGGNGNDKFTFSGYEKISNVTISMGAGADTIALQQTNISNTKVVDFSATDGDLIDLTQLVPYQIAGNPFGTLGYFKASQDGNNVVISFDQDGAADQVYGMRPILTLENVRLQDLSANNFKNGWNPTGSEAGEEIHGTINDDNLIGKNLNDTIYGDTGNDLLQGNSGDDLLYGEAGNDKLFGDNGNDNLLGGLGNDELRGGTGNDVLEGGDGDDNLNDNEGTNVLRGGAGNDQISVGANGSFADGGDGNDSIETSGGLVTIEAGTGDDIVRYGYFWGSPSNQGTGTINLGDGNDTFVFSPGSPDSFAIVSGGNGKDTYKIASTVINGHLTINDFQTGTGGDVIEVSELMSNYDYQGGNPFGAGGILRIIQKGQDTVIEYDYDGPTHLMYSFRPIITLKNVQANTLSVANFNDSINPNGSELGLTIRGTSKDDTLQGKLFNDILFGGAGNDIIYGDRGNDELHGDSGDDQLNGGPGNDTLYGDAGNDALTDSEQNGDNTLYGGDGNDSLSTTGIGSNILNGGNGDDMISAGRGNDILNGENGNDIININLYYSADQYAPNHLVRVNGGNGNDRITLANGYDSNESVKLDIRGGDGIDTFSMYKISSKSQFVINDFTPGAKGDFLDLTNLIFYSVGGKNPFGQTGYARLLQRGDDTIVQIDTDGPDGFKQFQDAFILKNVKSTDLTAANFVNYYAPDGLSQGVEREGDDQNDNLIGSTFNDILRGNAGDDYIHGSVGDDQLFGGPGNDQLVDDMGSNTFSGGEGNDTIYVSSNANNRANGDAGDDTLNISNGSGIFNGGEGNDIFNISSPYFGDWRGNLTLNGDAGQDLFNISAFYLYDVKIDITGGSGRDIFKISPYADKATTSILDFDTSANGDKISLAAVIDYLGHFNIADRNPFREGYLRLQQNDKDTELVLDIDGAGSSIGKTILTLKNTDASQLNQNHFVEFYDPKGSTDGLTLTGDNAANQLFGGWSSDTLSGLAGNDILDGRGGNDTLNGGAGDDTFIAGVGDDNIFGDAGFDTVVFEKYFNSYKLTKTDGGFNVVGKNYWNTEGSDNLSGVEYLKFSNMNVNLTVKEKASGVAASDIKTLIELYIAFFNRTPDADGMSYWIDQLKGGQSMTKIAETFYSIGASEQFTARTGFTTTMSDDDFIHTFYRNVLGRTNGADEAGLSYWKNKLTNGTSTRSTLAQDILTSAHTFKGNADLGYVADLLDNKYAVGKTVAIDWGINFTENAYDRSISIANAVTATSTDLALQLVGVNPSDFQFF